MAKYVELSVEDLRTRVQFPPSPPLSSTATSNAVLETAFFFVRRAIYRPCRYCTIRYPGSIPVVANRPCWASASGRHLPAHPDDPRCASRHPLCREQGRAGELAAQTDGTAQQERGGGRLGEQECPGRVGALGQRSNIPPRLHTGIRVCRNVIEAVE